MKQIKVSDLEGEQLSEWAARAQELEEYIGDVSGDRFYILPCGSHIKVEDYRPHINGAQAFDLQVKFDMVTASPKASGEEKWAAGCASSIPMQEPIFGDTLEIAITRAAIASVYGETVTVEDE